MTNNQNMLELSDFDDFIAKHKLAHPKNKYYLNVEKCSRLTYGTYNPKTGEIKKPPPSNTYYPLFIDRMNKYAIFESDESYIHIDCFVVMLKNQSNIIGEMTKFIQIAENIKRNLYREVPFYLDREVLESDTKIMNVLSSNLLNDNINQRVEDHIKCCEDYIEICKDHITELRNLMKVVNENANIKNSYMFTRLLELKQEITHTKIGEVVGHLVTTDDFAGLTEKIFGDKMTDELFEMIDKCIDENNLMIMTIGKSNIINDILDECTLVEKVTACPKFAECMLALTSKEPFSITCVRPRKSFDYHFIPIDASTFITSSDAYIFNSAMLNYSNPRVWKLDVK